MFGTLSQHLLKARKHIPAADPDQARRRSLRTQGRASLWWLQSSTCPTVYAPVPLGTLPAPCLAPLGLSESTHSSRILARITPFPPFTISHKISTRSQRTAEIWLITHIFKLNNATLCHPNPNTYKSAQQDVQEIFQVGEILKIQFDC